jgi:hypothetical protein
MLLQPGSSSSRSCSAPAPILRGSPPPTVPTLRRRRTTAIASAAESRSRSARATGRIELRAGAPPGVARSGAGLTRSCGLEAVTPTARGCDAGALPALVPRRRITEGTAATSAACDRASGDLTAGGLGATAWRIVRSAGRGRPNGARRAR